MSSSACMRRRALLSARPTSAQRPWLANDQLEISISVMGCSEQLEFGCGQSRKLWPITPRKFYMLPAAPRDVSSCKRQSNHEPICAHSLCKRILRVED